MLTIIEQLMILNTIFKLVTKLNLIHQYLFSVGNLINKDKIKFNKLFIILFTYTNLNVLKLNLRYTLVHIFAIACEEACIWSECTLISVIH